MWDISEGDNKFLYAMILVPPKEIGSIVYLDNIDQKYYSYQQSSQVLPLFIMALFIDKHAFVIHHGIIYRQAYVRYSSPYKHLRGQTGFVEICGK